MDFIKAIIEISKRKDLELCTLRKELIGELDICVYYKDSEFIGKLRWPKLDNNGKFIPAGVDDLVKIVLKKKLTKKQFDKKFPLVSPLSNKNDYKGFKNL